MAKKKNTFEDDGRTIANMNVEGMPWYTEKKERKETPESEPIELNKQEKRAMMGGIMKATMLVTLVFGIGFTAFILLCVYVFFR